MIFYCQISESASAVYSNSKTGGFGGRRSFCGAGIGILPPVLDKYRNAGYNSEKYTEKPIASAEKKNGRCVSPADPA